jgi:peptidoglycan/xylan/chitin deacetylase (PgdA/CDA1 family)
MLVAANFHYIRPSFDSKFPGIMGKTPSEFDRQIKLYKTISNVISPKQLNSAVNNNELPLENSLIITFDDGLKEQYIHALPILERHGVSALFFINTRTLVEPYILPVHKTHILRSMIGSDALIRHLKESFETSHNIKCTMENFSSQGQQHYKYDTKADAALKYLLNFVLSNEEMEDFMNSVFNHYFCDQEELFHKQLYMNREEVAFLCKKEMVGSHSHDHLSIGTLNPDRRVYQIQESVEIFNNLFNYQPAAFSYPYGSKEASFELGKILKKSGFHYAFTMERAINESLIDPFALSRFDNNDLPLGKAYKFDNHNIFENFNKKNWQLN